MTSVREGSPPDSEGVELIEQGSLGGLELGGGDPEVSAEADVVRSPVVGPMGFAALALVAILVALVLMSRPGVEEDAGIERAQTTLPVAPTTTAPAPRASTPSDEPVLLPAIPAFDSNLPDGLPGVIDAVAETGSRIVIDRTTPGPTEVDDGSEPEPDGVATGLPASGLVPLGPASDDGETVVHLAGRIWAVDADGGERLVAEGAPLSYDGVNLAWLDCPSLVGCELVVGTLDRPDRWRQPLPDVLADQPIDDWASTVSVSPEGNRLALIYGNGALPQPMVIDLATGDRQLLADGVNLGSPVAWSPDGRWLAYLYTDDVMVWSFDDDRSWRVIVNRPLETVQWR